ncbi:MAG: hypothetical protein CSA82_03540 [Actinobacteria bacterium]|nr:MAG: hypothetical protein CSA82_03540 [Actinomycetota bacterium]
MDTPDGEKTVTGTITELNPGQAAVDDKPEVKPYAQISFQDQSVFGGLKLGSVKVKVVQSDEGGLGATLRAQNDKKY